MIDILDPTGEPLPDAARRTYIELRHALDHGHTNLFYGCMAPELYTRANPLVCATAAAPLLTGAATLVNAQPTMFEEGHDVAEIVALGGKVRGHGGLEFFRPIWAVVVHRDAEGPAEPFLRVIHKPMTIHAKAILMVAQEYLDDVEIHFLRSPKLDEKLVARMQAHALRFMSPTKMGNA